MSDHIILGTRKGAILLDLVSGRWKPQPIAHSGVPVSYAARDPRDGTLWAALEHGHWGPKLSRSKDGKTWEDTPQIKYPEGARYVAGYEQPPEGTPADAPKKPQYKNAKLLKLWVMGFGGKDQPGPENILSPRSAATGEQVPQLAGICGSRMLMSKLPCPYPGQSCCIHRHLTARVAVRSHVTAIFRQ
jgi:hypothetical protein